MKLLNRYATAIHSDDLTSSPKTKWSDSDVLGAAGFAAKAHPLSAALYRVILGDNRAVEDAVRLLSGSAISAMWYRRKLRVSQEKARHGAMIVIAWYRNNTCRPCDGTGYAKERDAPVRINICSSCNGTGKTRLDTLVPDSMAEIVDWMAAEVDRRQHEFGPAAMASLANKLDL